MGVKAEKARRERDRAAEEALRAVTISSSVEEEVEVSR